MTNTIEKKIYESLQTCGDLNWHSWHWWEHYDNWFAQFEPEYIDSIAQNMAEKGIIETNGRGGYRRKEKTLKEKILVKFF